MIEPRGGGSSSAAWVDLMAPDMARLAAQKLHGCQCAAAVFLRNVFNAEQRRVVHYFSLRVVHLGTFECGLFTRLALQCGTLSR